MSTLLLLLVLSLSAPSFGKKKPSDFFTLCRKSDPDLSSCVKNTITEALPRLIKGIPELKLQPIDPMVISKISMAHKENNFRLSMALTNLTVEGLKDIELKSLEFDNKFSSMNFTSFTKFLSMKGDYAIDGHIVIPVKGNGKCTLEFDDLTFNNFVTFEEYEKKGETYVACKSYSWDFSPLKARSYFTNLFNGDKALGDNANKYFNDNWKETLQTYKQLPETAFGKLYKEYINRPMSLYPVKDWFLN